MSVSRKYEVQKYFLTNKLIMPVVGAPQLAFFGKLLYSFKYNAKAIQVPTYIHLGEKDRIVSNDEAKIFYDKMTCPKKMTIYSYAKHELHIDATKEVF
jgi:esterase/lipase